MAATADFKDAVTLAPTPRAPAGPTPLVSPVSLFDSLVGASGQYGPIPLPTVGDQIAPHEQWRTFIKECNFYDASYIGGPAFKNAVDIDGQPVLISHEKETTTGYNRRKRLSVYANHCRAIIDRFNSFVFRQDVKRDGADPVFTEWRGNVDLHGTELHVFMRQAVRDAQKFGRYFVGIDTNLPDAPDAQPLTVAQAQFHGAQVILRRIDPRRMVDWRRESGVLTEALVLYGSGDHAILWTHTMRSRISLDADGSVSSVLGPVPHDWPGLPIVEVAPFDGQSQIRDIAELNRDLFNMESLLREETYGNTFTQRWLTGVRPEELKSETGELITANPSTVICIPNPDAKLTTTGGDPAQAESIRQTAQGAVTEIYRQAGMRAEDPLTVGQAQSGIALKMRFDDLAAQLMAISEEAERVEAQIVIFYNAATGARVGRPEYPDRFGDPDVLLELERAAQVADSPLMPPTAKLLEIKRVVRLLHPGATQEQQRAMDQEVDAMLIPAEGEKSAGFPVEQSPGVNADEDHTQDDTATDGGGDNPTGDEQ